jgi:predicted Fe-S protein YdhL (DUF1289 family)
VSDTDPGVIFRLTVKRPDGSNVFGPKTYLSDGAMIRGIRNWESRAVKEGWTLVREGAVRGAWLDLDAQKAEVHGADDPWNITVAPGHVRHQDEIDFFESMTPEEVTAWDAMSQEERDAAFAEAMSFEVPPLPEISVPRGGIRWPQSMTQAEWERRATEQFGPSPRDQASSAEIDAWNAMTPQERRAYVAAHRTVPKYRD